MNYNPDLVRGMIGDSRTGSFGLEWPFMPLSSVCIVYFLDLNRLSKDKLRDPDFATVDESKQAVAVQMCYIYRPIAHYILEAI